MSIFFFRKWRLGCFFFGVGWVGIDGKDSTWVEVGGPFKSHVVDASEIRPSAVDIESLTLLLGFCISQPVQGFLPSTVWKRSCGISTKKKSERTGRNGRSWKVPLVPASTQLPTVTLSLTRSLLVQGDWCFFNTFLLVLGTYWFWFLKVSGCIWVFPKIFSNFKGLFHYKPSILWVFPYFWKHPYNFEFLDTCVSWKSWSQDPNPPQWLSRTWIHWHLCWIQRLGENWPTDFTLSFLSTRKESNSTYTYNIYIIYIWIYVYICIVELTSAMLQEKKRLKVVYVYIYTLMIICVYTPTYIHTHTHTLFHLRISHNMGCSLVPTAVAELAPMSALNTGGVPKWICD